MIFNPEIRRAEREWITRWKQASVLPRLLVDGQVFSGGGGCIIARHRQANLLLRSATRQLAARWTEPGLSPHSSRTRRAGNWYHGVRNLRNRFTVNRCAPSEIRGRVGRHLNRWRAVNSELTATERGPSCRFVGWGLNLPREFWGGFADTWYFGQVGDEPVGFQQCGIRLPEHLE